MKLIRKHYQITPEQEKKIKALVRPGVSESDIIREALDLYFKQKEGKGK